MLRDCNVNKSFYEHVLYNPANNKSDFIFVSVQKATNSLTLLNIPIYETYIFYFSLYTCLLTCNVTIFCNRAFFSIIKLVFREKKWVLLSARQKADSVIRLVLFWLNLQIYKGPSRISAILHIIISAILHIIISVILHIIISAILHIIISAILHIIRTIQLIRVCGSATEYLLKIKNKNSQTRQSYLQFALV